MGMEFLVPALFGAKAAAVLGFAAHQISAARKGQDTTADTV